MNILIIEDDDIIGTLVKQTLKRNGYHVNLVGSGIEGEQEALSHPYDCMILDLGLPDRDGLEICKNLRTAGNKTPLLILSAYDAINTKVDGLEIGADDYLTKPFENKELVARVQALIRRNRINESREILSFGELELNLLKRTFIVNGNEVSLTNNEFDLMAYFLRDPERVISADELAEKVWNFEVDRKTNYVNVYLSYIRKKIRKYSDKRYFITIRKKGFRLSPG